MFRKIELNYVLPQSLYESENKIVYNSDTLTDKHIIYDTNTWAPTAMLRENVAYSKCQKKHKPNL